MVTRAHIVLEKKKSVRTKYLVLVLVAIVCLLTVDSFAQENKSDISKLVGDWTGESICANKEKFPACKDEHVIYTIKLTPNKSDTVTATMDKIVNGQRENMGEGDFVYDQKKQTLVSEYKNSRVHLTIEFVVKGDVIEGIVAELPERTLVRNIKIKKDR